MKHKYVSMKHFIYYDEKCIQYLEDMSRQGWRLQSLDTFFAKFVPSLKTYKYQIDYISYNQEYLDMIKEQGYQFIDCHNDIYVYANEDFNAPDLQTDEEVKQQILLRRYSKKFMIFLGIIGMILMICGALLSWQMYHQEKGLFYIHFHYFLTGLLSLLIGLLLIDDAREINIKRKRIIENHYSKQYLHQLDIYHTIKTIMSFLIIIVYIYKVLINDSFSSIESWSLFYMPDYIILFLGLYIIITISLFLKDRVHNQHGYYIYTGLISSVCILCLSLSISFIDPKRPQDIPYADNIFHISYNPYIKEIQAIKENPNEELLRQIYYHCKDETIAEEVFHYRISEEEKYTRVPSEEEIHKITSTTGSWSSDDIDRLPYKQALLKYQSYPSQYSDQCYYLHDIVIAKKKNIVVRLNIDDVNTIDDILKEYNHIYLK